MNQTQKKTEKAQTPVHKNKVKEDWANFDFTYLGERVKEARIACGLEREQMSDLLEISKAQYGNFERENSASIKVCLAAVNYFATIHNISIEWLLLKDNKHVNMRTGDRKDMNYLMQELNEIVKPHGLMVSLVKST